MKEINRKALINLVLFGILFCLVNALIYIYLKNYTVAFRPLIEKSRGLFNKYPESNIIIGGDSIAEEGIDPRILSPRTINIAIAGGGINGALKAISQFKQTSSELVILNLSLLNLNESIIHGDLYINQADTFLDIGAWYLLKSWKKNFLEKLWTLYQCRFSSCPYTLDNLETFESFKKTLVQKGYLSSERSISRKKDSKEAFVAQYRAFYEEKFNSKGPVFINYQKKLAELVKQDTKVAIVLMPMSNTFKKNILEFGTDENIQNFLRAVERECSKYINCKSFNYSNSNNSYLGDAQNTDDYFSDYMHLNRLGSESFTKILKGDLESAHFLN